MFTRILAICGVLLSTGVATPAETPSLPKPSDIRKIEVYPTSLKLVGTDDSPQLVVTATLADGKLRDLTSDMQFDTADKKVLRVTSAGRVLPLTNGSTMVSATFGTHRVEVPVTTESMDVALPISFANQIEPIFTKLGCNSGGCHGKISGQNGFRLSLLGFDHELDYTTLVKEGRGRRFFAASPDASLFLMKATGRAPHGGGRKLEPDSDEYKLLRRWVASGVPYGDPEKEPYVKRIEVYPASRILSKQDKQQVSIRAHYSDGRIEDVSRRAQYESNETDIATVDAQGLVQTLSMNGEAAIMARFQGNVNIIRIAVPLTGATPEYKFEVKNVIDKFALKKWKELGLVPSERTTDDQFVRRVYLDITGTLPTPDQVSKFVADKDAKKRDKLVDALVDTPEYSYYFANKWADILRVKRGNQQAGRAYGTFAFHGWIRDAIARDMRYDDFVSEIVGAVGDETKNPPTVWYKDITTPEQFVDNLAQVFLGLRMACANCHHHPYEKWSQDDYWSLAAFYGRVGRKAIPTPGITNQNGRQNQRQILYSKSSGNVVNKRTNKNADMRPLDGEPMTVADDVDPRHKLAEWLTDAKNPFFAKAVANRYFAHFFGRGIVDPLDDMRVTNPPSNPELLDAIAKELTDNGYSLKHLIKLICKSETYQLSSAPNEFNKHDKQAYARYYPKRMSAEVLFDAVCQVTASPTSFTGLPPDKFAPNRAIMLPDESYASYFLDVFGRPQRLSACECERVSEANLAQTLHLLNSDEVQGKLNRQGGRPEMLAKEKDRPDEEKVTELFMWTLGRKPTDVQLANAIKHIGENKDNKRIAFENILWALINSKGFIFNQ